MFDKFLIDLLYCSELYVSDKIMAFNVKMVFYSEKLIMIAILILPFWSFSVLVEATSKFSKYIYIYIYIYIYVCVCVCVCVSPG